MSLQTTRPAMIDSGRLLRVIEAQTQIVRLGLDLPGVATLAAEIAMNLTAAEGAVVTLAEGGELVYRAVAGVAEPYLGIRIPCHGSLAGLSLQLGTALRCDDTENDPRVYRESCRKVGIRSMIVVPLHHDDEAVGVFGAYSGHCNAFDDADVAILELMGTLIAASMFHAAHNRVGTLLYRATHDLLTGLANRTLFLDRLRHCRERARRERTKYGVVVLDMDGMKQINDRWGHRAGDAALRELARRLKHHSRSSDSLARLGGDEFAVILSRISDRAGIAMEIQRASHALEQPFEFEGKVLTLNASMGGALYPDDADEIDALLDAADQAMYEQKRIKRELRRAEGQNAECFLDCEAPERREGQRSRYPGPGRWNSTGASVSPRATGEPC
jgi:diguanylate cyclase